MGLAKVKLNVVDKTAQPPTQSIGIGAIAIQTQKGRIGTPVFCRSYKEFREEFGEIVDTDDTLGPVYAQRMFANGAQLYVTRIVHYTDINDETSYTPVVADGDNSGVFNFSEEILAVDEVLDTLMIQGDFTDYIAATDVHVVQKVGGGTTNLTVASVAYAGGFTTITYVAIVGGDATSGDALTWSKTLSATLEYEASSPGSWGNVISVEIKRAASGLANMLDIFVRTTDTTVINSDIATETYRNFPTVPVTADVEAFNTTMKIIQIPTGGVLSTPIGVVPVNLLTSGADDYAGVVDTDYIGSVSANTGIQSFSSDSGWVRMACPEVTSNLVDNALLAFCILRDDCLAISRTPASLSASAAIDYRNAEGVYSAGTKLDDWRGIMLYGGITITNPWQGANGGALTIGTIADYFGLSAVKDRVYGPWVNVSNVQRGTLTNVRDIVYNINTPNRAQEADDLTNAGLFPIIKEKENGVQRIVFWGDRSLQTSVSLLQDANVSDLLIHIKNGIRPISKAELFNPNDVLTWKTIYRKVRDFMQIIQDGGGITTFDYQGDQDVDVRSEAIINTPTTIAQGKYLFDLFFEPITSINEITGTLTLESAASASGISTTV